MSKYEDGSYQCLPGPALIAKVLAGRCLMRYTRAAVGKGTLPDGVSPKELTEPPEYVMDAMIASVTNPVNGECQVTVQINSSDVETGFYANYIILYAEDPDEGEVPYTCLKTEDGLEWIRPKTSAVGKLATFDLIAAVGDVDTVAAVIDPNSIVTAEYVDQAIQNHNADPDAHAEAIETAVEKQLEEAAQEGGVIDTVVAGAIEAEMEKAADPEQGGAVAQAMQTAAEAAVQQSLESGEGKEQVETIVREMANSGELSTGGGIVKVIEAVLTPENWYSDPNPVNGYIYLYDLADEDITAELMPEVVVAEASRKIATDTGMSLTAETFDGYIRLKAESKPTEEISLICYLLAEAGGAGGGSYAIPPATADTLGGVKVGAGLSVSADGTLSVNNTSVAEEISATDEEAAEALADTLNGGE